MVPALPTSEFYSAPAGDMVVKAVVPKVLELIEDLVFRIGAKLSDLVVDLFDIGL